MFPEIMSICLLQIFTKAGKQHLIRRALDIKNVITNMTEKVGKLKFVRNKKVKSQRRKSGAKGEIIFSLILWLFRDRD